MLAKRAPKADARAALRELLSALAMEVGDLALTAEGLQDLVGRLMERCDPAPLDALERAQALDELTQRLAGLNTFLCALETRTLVDIAADAREASAGLGLTRQARRLGRSVDAACATVDLPGEDLF